MLLALVFAALTNAVQLFEALKAESIGDSFVLDGVVSSDIYANDNDFAIQDASGSVIVLPSAPNDHPTPGDVIHAQGTVERHPFGQAIAVCKSIRIVSKGRQPMPKTASFREIRSGACDACTVRTTGMLRDYFSDEIASDYHFLILNDNDETIYVASLIRSPDDAKRLEGLIGQRLSVVGLCDPYPTGNRRMIGRLIRVNGQSAIQPETQAPHANPFAAPLLDKFTVMQPTQLHTLGRRRTKGQVLAVWQPSSLLLATEDGQISRIEIANAEPPAFDSTIEIVGFPETDLYRVNFSRAIWRPCPAKAALTSSPTNISASALMTDQKQRPAINPGFHGRVVRLRGTVRSLPSIGNDGRFHLDCDGYTLPVDISANPSLVGRLEIGNVVDVTGVCVMDIENWRPNLVFPHIKEVMIVTRTPADIVIVRRLPWWTPVRLTIVIGSLLTALLGILIWNRSLQVLARKRGKALANEELERLESDLKVCERTRLAVELHDSIAQNLTGVAMEIDTTLRGDEPLPPAAAQHMGRAIRTIDSCRSELRNCLWDLRSQALEEEDMNKAIRLTLSQTINKADLTVRFNVPRARFTDNTAHTILRIIRELTANAIRHGKASEIRVAGSIENDVLKFSVRDNGCGFDPDACPGVLDGHFGLQGVRERIASLEGDVQIESELGKGTKVVVSISAPQTEDEAKI